MVVPVPQPATPVKLSETRKFLGNNLQLRFAQNTCTLLVIGNNSSVRVDENFGLVKVVGNNCSVEIDECQGTVQYLGNNGQIILGGNVKSDAVTYIGANGNLQMKNGRNQEKKQAKHASKSAAKEGNQQSACYNITVGNGVLLENTTSFQQNHFKFNGLNLNNFMPFTIPTN